MLAGNNRFCHFCQEETGGRLIVFAVEERRLNNHTMTDSRMVGVCEKHLHEKGYKSETNYISKFNINAKRPS